MANFTFDMGGFDDFLQDLEKKVSNIGGVIPFSKLFDNSFLTKHTTFSSVDEFFDSGGFDFESEEEFDAIPEDKLDAHVKNNTDFSTWKEMLDQAAHDYAEKELNLL